MYTRTQVYKKAASSAPKGMYVLLELKAVGSFVFRVFSVMLPTLSFGYVAPCHCTLHQLGVRSSFTLHPTAIRLHCNSRYCCYTTCYIFALCELTTIF